MTAIERQFIEFQVKELILAGFSDEFILQALAQFNVSDGYSLLQAIKRAIASDRGTSQEPRRNDEDDDLQWVYLSSSLIRAVALDKKRNECVVRFKDGGTARYTGRAFEILKNSGSPGKTWNFAFRNRNI